MKNLELIETSVDKDCFMIVDAVRRLKDGVWQLCDEDLSWAQDLLPRIREALADHIEFEQACLFPGLSKKDVQEHKADHERILALLWALEISKRTVDAEHFRSLLEVLLDTLEEHHEKFGCHHPGQDACEISCATDRIVRRSLGTSLECK